MNSNTNYFKSNKSKSTCLQRPEKDSHISRSSNYHAVIQKYIQKNKPSSVRHNVGNVHNTRNVSTPTQLPVEPRIIQSYRNSREKGSTVCSNHNLSFDSKKEELLNKKIFNRFSLETTNADDCQQSYRQLLPPNKALRECHTTRAKPQQQYGSLLLDSQRSSVRQNSSRNHMYYQLNSSNNNSSSIANKNNDQYYQHIPTQTSPAITQPSSSFELPFNQSSKNNNNNNTNDVQLKMNMILKRLSKNQSQIESLSLMMKKQNTIEVKIESMCRQISLSEEHILSLLSKQNKSQKMFEQVGLQIERVKSQCQRSCQSYYAQCFQEYKLQTNKKITQISSKVIKAQKEEQQNRLRLLNKNQFAKMQEQNKLLLTRFNHDMQQIQKQMLSFQQSCISSAEDFRKNYKDSILSLNDQIQQHDSQLKQLNYQLLQQQRKLSNFQQNDDHDDTNKQLQQQQRLLTRSNKFCQEGIQLQYKEIIQVVSRKSPSSSLFADKSKLILNALTPTSHHNAHSKSLISKEQRLKKQISSSLRSCSSVLDSNSPSQSPRVNDENQRNSCFDSYISKFNEQSYCQNNQNTLVVLNQGNLFSSLNLRTVFCGLRRFHAGFRDVLSIR